ncbi:unnamed protein product [Cochlearia groenlandica]
MVPPREITQLGPLTTLISSQDPSVEQSGSGDSLLVPSTVSSSIPNTGSISTTGASVFIVYFQDQASLRAISVTSFGSTFWV